jgi:glycosyltransferase involved in cell wall biosynthesis
MKIAYFLPAGGSLESLEKTGQLTRFLKGELSFYLQHFEKIYIFDYSNKHCDMGDSRIIQVCNDSKWHRFLYSFIFPIKYRKTIRQCDVIRVSHLTGVLPAILAKISYGKPFAFNFAYDYAGFAWSEKKYIHSIMMKILKIIAFFFADGVIFANKKLLSDNLKYWNLKSAYVPNGVDIQKFKPRDLKNYKKNNKEYKILCVGRLEKQKNIFNLVKAINSLNDSSIKLTIIGHGEESTHIKSFLQQNRIKCEIIPKVNNEDLVGYYQHCDLFVLPSLAEGSSKVLLEAMACGCICLVSNIKANSEIVIDGVNGLTTGVTFDEIVKKIKNVKIKGNLDKMRSNARRTIEEKYSMDAIMKREIDFVTAYV